MIPRKLIVRGAKGFESFNDGSLELDFAQLAPGLIAVVAPNGTGKTTLLELLTPYNDFPSHTGAFHKGFFLKDSLKDYTFEFNGKVYRVKSVIDGEKGKAATWLYENGHPLNEDGKGFDALAEKVFGPKNIFFKSVFMKQPTILSDDRGIISMENAPAKEFFYQLMPGFERYPLVIKQAEIFREREEAVQLKLAADRDDIIRQIDRNNIDIGRENEIETSLKEFRGKADVVKSMLLEKKLALQELEHRNSKAEDIQKQAGKLKSDIGSSIFRETELHTKLNQTIDRIGSDIKNHEREIERVNKIVANADTIKAKIERLEEIKNQVAELDELKTKHITAQLKLDNVNTRIESHNRQIKQAIENTKTNLVQAEKVSSQLGLVPCKDTADFVATCPLIAHAREAKDRAADLVKKLADYEKATVPTELLSEKQSAEEALKSLKPYDDESKKTHRELKAELDELNRNDWARFKSDLDKSETIIEAKQELIASLKEQESSTITDYDQRVKEEQIARAKLDAELALVVKQLEEFGETFQKQLIEARQEVSELEKQQQDISENIGLARGQLDNIHRLEDDNIDLQAHLANADDDLKTIARNIAEYTLIERAFSRNEIPAMKLEAIAPEISSVATEILNGFGIGWVIDIKTTRRDSRDKKDIETFDITVLRGGKEDVCKDLSGGQQVWVELALRNAIAIYVTNHSGRDYRTMFRDESDGPLDVEKARAFLDVARSTHKLTGAHYTFIITQRPDIYNQVEQRIVLNPDSRQVEIEVE